MRTVSLPGTRELEVVPPPSRYLQKQQPPMPRRITSAEAFARGAGMDTPTSRAVAAELASLSDAINYASVQSHLYSDAAEARLPRPPLGISLPWQSNLRHIAVIGVERRLAEPLKNQLGRSITLAEPALATSTRGHPLPESTRAIMARGGASTGDALGVPIDAELRAYEATKGSVAERAASQKGTAAEIMSRAFCACRYPIPPRHQGARKPPFMLTTPPPQPHPPLCARRRHGGRHAEAHGRKANQQRVQRNLFAAAAPARCPLGWRRSLPQF